MTSIRLVDIATRQRGYLIRDVIFAVFVAVVLGLQISAFAG
jgi:hypothetical protein